MIFLFDKLEISKLEILISLDKVLKLEKNSNTKMFLGLDFEGQNPRAEIHTKQQKFNSDTKQVEKYTEITIFDLSKVFGFRYIEYAEELPQQNLQPVQPTSNNN